MVSPTDGAKRETVVSQQSETLERIFPGDGEMALRMRAFEGQSALGAIERWPAELKSTLSVCLSARFPMAIYWGREGYLFYNDAWRPILGDKHPQALGRPAREVWPEIWHVIGPLFASVFETGEATWRGDALLPMQRFGYTEECYFDYTFNPIRDQSGKIAGILNVVQETTYRVLNERRMKLLRELASPSAAAKNRKDSCERSIAALATDSADIPFALLYLLEDGGRRARLQGATGLAPGSAASPELIDLADERSEGGWPLRAALAAGATVVDDLSARFGRLPGGPWPEPTTSAIIIPVKPAAQEPASAILIAGVNPRHPLDDEYGQFFENVASHIGHSLANAGAAEEVQRRLESLAQLDRARTVFFSNVSHEFRTPLTLILGPAEELLAGNLGETNEIQRAHLMTLQRNAVRLQKLVNTLLDFARVEAGRIEANYEPVDIGLVTRDLASTFSSAVHRAGLLFIMNCPSIDAPVYVDRDMWEKIVLNLLSNALKFTLEGMIEVTLKESGEESAVRSEEAVVRSETEYSPGTPHSLVHTPGHVILTVRDTGAGIPKDELPRLFDRFHRVLSTRSRTQEGSGIGLALVQELVRLHGGAITVESELDKGTTFSIAIPKGTEHLPKERLGAARKLSSTALGAAPFVEEALSWLPGAEPADRVALPVSAADLIDAPPLVRAPVERILIADDNLEMRNYLIRLLETRWRVTAVEDGAKALAAAREQRPDLVLSDVMMPGLDGFGLLRALRGDDRTKAIPVILLSARAGDEAYIEGLSAGADDYIVKPFGARELIARVKALLEVTRVRRESERRVTSILESITDGFQVIDADWRLTYMNSEARHALAEHGIDPEWALGRHFLEEVLATVIDGEAAAHQRRAMTERVPVFFETFYAPWRRWYSVRVYPLPEGGVVNYFQDITEHREARETKARFAAIVESSADAIISKDLDGLITSWNRGAERLFGYSAEEAIGRPVTILMPPERADEEPNILARIRRGEGIEHYETVRRRKDGKLLDISLTVSPIIDESGRIIGASKIARDITEPKRVEQALRRSEERFRTMADSSPIMIWMTDAQGRILFLNQAFLDYCGITVEQTSTFEWSRVIHADEREFYVSGFENALRQRETFYRRVRLRRHDGEWRWFEARCNPIFDEAGNLVAFIGSAPDITDIYQSQQALRELGQRKDEFLANMSHEIRSPLTAIMGYADILLDRLRDPADIEYLKTIKESGDYLIEIVNDILDLSKIEAGKLVLNIEPVGVYELLSEVQNLMAGRARQKNLALGLRYEGALPESTRTDRTRLRQILINLVSNAIKFTERGHVDIVARLAHGQLEIAVLDTGIGIAPEHQKILFQPFTQADTTSTREYGGTGLGLTITKRLVEMLGGTISFESEPGRGSVFRVAVPVGATVEESPPKRLLQQLSDIPSGEGALRDRRVLVVDDREEICYLVSRYIREAGGQTEEATEGKKALEAVAAANSAPFDAVVLDIHMPGMDGYDVARALRAQGNHVPIIALTAGAMVGDREKCLAAGFDDYLTKPIDRRKLVELVAERTRARVEVGAHQRVLLVDDSHNACTFLSLFLEKRGYQVRAAHDGESALAAARDFRPGVVVLDIRLPDMDGFELMRRLKQLDGIDRAKFIGLSGYRDGAQPYDGFDHFLEKPLDTAHLDALLRDFSG